jgi:integrase
MLAELRKLEPAADLKNWRIHDVRRTARTLMARAGVDPDHAERALGHVIGGVRGTYDRHRFETEKLGAFEALAAQVQRIVDPQPNVTPLKRAKQPA